MWAKLVQTIIAPLVEKLVVGLWKRVSTWVKDWLYRRSEKKRAVKLKKVNEQKVKEYEESTNVDDASDNFGKLP